MTTYHDIAAADPLVALSALHDLALTWYNMSVYTSDMRVYDASGELHIFRSQPQVAWTKRGRTEIMNHLKGMIFLVTATERNNNLITMCEVYNSYWSNADYPAGYNQVNNYINNTAANGERLDFHLWVESDTENPGEVLLKALQLTKTYNPLGFYSAEITDIGANAGGTPLPQGSAGIDVEVINYVDCNPDFSGIIQELAAINSNTDQLEAIATIATSIEAIFGAAAAAGTVGATIAGFNPLIQAIQVAMQGIDTFLTTSGMDQIRQAINDCHLDLDGIESHVSHLGTIRTDFNERFELIANHLNNHLDTIRLALVNVQQTLASNGLLLKYNDGTGDKSISQILSELELSGSSGGGLTYQEWETLLRSLFIAQEGQDDWNLSEAIISLVNTGYTIYK